MFRFFVLFFWRHHSLATEKKFNFSLLTLHHIRQGAFPLAGCLHAAGYIQCSELRLVAVFVSNKIEKWHAIFLFFLFNFVPQQILNLFLCFTLCLHHNLDNRSSSKSITAEVLCVLFTLRHHSLVTEKEVYGSWTYLIWTESYLTVTQLSVA